MKYYFTARLGETRYLQADGSLLCKDVPIARTGTQIYLPEEVDLEPDPLTGTVTVWRTEDEVFSTETMASFEGVAVTLEHPEGANGEIVFVNPPTTPIWPTDIFRMFAAALAINQTC